MVQWCSIAQIIEHLVNLFLKEKERDYIGTFLFCTVLYSVTCESYIGTFTIVEAKSTARLSPKRGIFDCMSRRSNQISGLSPTTEFSSNLHMQYGKILCKVNFFDR